MLSKKLKLESVLLLLVIISGLFISIFQFAHNRSLWLDEAYLALNILDRGFSDLLRSLDYYQVAPILFLYIEKLFTLLFGGSEYALRLFPLICYFTSIYFLYRIFKILNLNSYVIILSLALFMFNGSIIYYSSEVKQYMTDVMIITGMYFFMLKEYKSPKTKYFSLAIAGSVSIFLSNVSPIILLCCGLYLLYKSYKNKWSEFRSLLIISFVWALIFAIYFFVFIHGHPTKNFMIMYWTNYGAFMPDNLMKGEFYKFIIDKYNAYFHESFQFGNVGFYALLLLFSFGCFHLFVKKKYDIFILSIAPLLIHQGLSSLKMYPFELRLILYTCPAFILLFANGFEFLIDKVKNPNSNIVKSVLVIATTLLLYNGYSQIPSERSEIKECFHYLNQNLEDEDKICFTAFSGYTFEYYSDIKLFDYSDHETYFGTTGDIISFVKTVNQLEGRVWFVISDYVDNGYTTYIKEHYKENNTSVQRNSLNG